MLPPPFVASQPKIFPTQVTFTEGKVQRESIYGKAAFPSSTCISWYVGIPKDVEIYIGHIGLKKQFTDQIPAWAVSDLSPMRRGKRILEISKKLSIPSSHQINDDTPNQNQASDLLEQKTEYTPTNESPNQALEMNFNHQESPTQFCDIKTENQNYQYVKSVLYNGQFKNWKRTKLEMYQFQL